MRNKVNVEDLVNWWLEKYHNTNLEKFLEENPDWRENPTKHTEEFYKKYTVTQEQHDEWEKWAKEYTKKVTGVKGKLFDNSWGWTYLNCAPTILK